MAERPDLKDCSAIFYSMVWWTKALSLPHKALEKLQTGAAALLVVELMNRKHTMTGHIINLLSLSHRVLRRDRRIAEFVSLN